MEGNKSEKTVNGRTGNERGILDGPSETRKAPVDLHCLAYFKDGKCPKNRWNTLYGALNLPGMYECYNCCMPKEDFNADKRR